MASRLAEGFVKEPLQFLLPVPKALHGGMAGLLEMYLKEAAVVLPGTRQRLVYQQSAHLQQVVNLV